MLSPSLGTSGHMPSTACEAPQGRGRWNSADLLLLVSPPAYCDILPFSFAGVQLKELMNYLVSTN